MRTCRANLLLKCEKQLHNAPLNKMQRQRSIGAGAREQKASFRHNSLTAQQRRLEEPNLFNSSLAMGSITT
jgi:hypothetical protein